MTTVEVCDLLVAAIRDTSRTRRERDDWRLLALVILDAYTQLLREVEMTNPAARVYRAELRKAWDRVHQQMSADTEAA